MNIKDQIAQESEAAELAERAVDDQLALPDHVKVTRGNGRSHTLQIRLNEDELEFLERIARSKQLPVSTVARALLLAGPSPTDDSEAVFERIERELANLRRLLDRP